MDFAEFQALEQKPMSMRDWVGALDTQILNLKRRVLQDSGKISHKKAMEKAEREFEIYRASEMRQMVSDFDRATKALPRQAGS